MFHVTLLLLLIARIIGMLLNRLSLLRFFLRYEILFLIISLSSLLLNTTTYEMILVVYPIRNPTFEVIMALCVVPMYSSMALNIKLFIHVLLYLAVFQALSFKNIYQTLLYDLKPNAALREGKTG